jgi:hypothetical protein
MKHVLPGHYFIFSVENPKHQVTASGVPSTEEAVKFLRQSGEDALDLHGHYDGKHERSILVRHPKNVKGLTEMARQLGQESVIHSMDNKHELKYLNGPQAGTSVHGSGVQFYKEKPDGDHSVMHTDEGPVHFKLNFNFGDQSNKLKKSEWDKELGIVSDEIRRLQEAHRHNRSIAIQEAKDHAQKIGHHDHMFLYHLGRAFGKE